MRPAELAVLSPNTAVAVVRQAAARIFKVDARSRGEAGELLLHASCRQEFKTTQLVARLYYKSSQDEQIHGFDCVHFRKNPDGKVELWLGEAKFYSSVDDAIAKARKSIKGHLDRGFLEAQKTLILPKIENEDANLAREVQHLLHRNTPIDDLVASMIVPVLIACDSVAVSEAKSLTAEYLQGAKQEMINVSNRLKKGSPFSTIKIQPIYVPLKSKGLA